NPLPSLLHTPSGLAIIEIQGTIHISPSPDAAATDSTTPHTPIGKLVFPYYEPNDPPESTRWMKRVHLYVGRHQRLTGEVKKLGKPLGVIRKRVTGEGEGEELEIVDVVRWKILFGLRPEPV
ncbi:hypothetical protein K490DRAFT_3919, partial [Saccharata proteae CBS 121410]